MSKPPPAFWQDPEADGEDLAPPVDPDRDEAPKADDDADGNREDDTPDGPPADR